MRLLANVTCVAVEGRGLLIEGPPGGGKSSLGLALIDRGAVLIGDDGVALEPRGGELWAHPPPNIGGKLEIRGVGLIDLPVRSAPIALVLALDRVPDRLPVPENLALEDVILPRLGFRAADPHPAIRAQWALQLHGLPISGSAK